MDKWLTDFMVKECKVGKLLLAPLDFLLLIGITFAGIMLRAAVFSYYFLNEEQVLYSKYMEIAFEMKIFSCICDVALAIMVAASVYRLTKKKIKTMLAYGITFVLPVVVSNSAMWGTADSAYLFFLVLAVSLSIAEKNDAALIVFGISLFLNGHAIFLLPLFALFLLQGKVHWYGFSVPLLGGILRYILMAEESGVKIPLFEVERILALSRECKLLSYGCPNVFGIIGADKFVYEYEKVAFAFAVGFAVMYVLFLLEKKVVMNTEWVLRVSVFLCMLLPFIAPNMNERSLLPICILSLIWGFYQLDKFWVPVVMTTIGYISYSSYFRGESAVPYQAVAFAMLVLICYLFYGQLMICRKTQEE